MKLNPLYLINAIEMLLHSMRARLLANKAGTTPILVLEVDGVQWAMGHRNMPRALIDGLGDNIERGGINDFHYFQSATFTDPRSERLREALNAWDQVSDHNAGRRLAQEIRSLLAD